MIIGTGLLAKRFVEKYSTDEAVVIFASGVSNSSERRPSEFDRERALLQSALSSTHQRFVYFSSCGASAAVPTTPYMSHKAQMESMVLGASAGLVLRLPQVVGETPNPHTLTNYLFSRISSGERFDVWTRAERNLIDIDDVYKLACEHIAIASAGQIVSIASDETLPMPEIVSIFERVVGKRAIFDLVDAGEPLKIDNERSSAIAARLNLHLGAGYTESTIRKYYGHSTAR